MRVLIVDGLEQHRHLLRASLQGHGCVVDEARHGAEALAKARVARPDLIVSDLLMPERDGYALLRHWKADDRLKDIPFVIHTAAFSESKDDRLVLNHGANAFNLKHAEPEAFLGQIGQLASETKGDSPRAARPPQAAEDALLRDYNQGVMHKLEQKNQQLEQVHRALREDVRRRQEAGDQANRLRIEAERSYAALRENEERLGLALSAANQGLFDPNVRTGEAVVSPEYARRLDYEPDELRETHAAWRERLHPKDRQAVCRAYQEYLARQRAPYRVECRQRAKSGEWKWILALGRLLDRDLSGEPLRMLGTHTDITGRKRLEEERWALEARLRQQQKLEAVGTLASGVAHKINNPINGMLNHARLIQDRLPRESPLREYATEILRETQRVAAIVNDLLTFPREENRFHTLARVADIVDRTVSLFRTAFRRDQIALSANAPEDLPPLNCRSHQLQQVPKNLLTNARGALDERFARHDPDKVVSVSAYLLQKAGPPCIRLTVEDRGTGIAPELRDRRFDPFFTTKPRFVAPVSPPIREWFSPRVSAFAPLPKGRRAPPQCESSIRTPPIPNRMNPRSRVLIVDDEKSIRRTLGEFLREASYEVAEAEDAEAAFRRLQEAPFDVVVSDIILPRVTGIELLQRIREVSPYTQVVMMTGEPTVDSATESLRAGAADYLFKPITKATVLRTVANAARIKELEDIRRRLEADNQAHRENLERLVSEQTAQLRESEVRARELSLFNQAVLDALTAHICVLGEDGTILAVNRAWSEFLRNNPPPSRNAEVGGNYFAVCDTVVGADRPTAQEAVRGLRAVARGEVAEFSLEYPCHSPAQQRWFFMRATRFGGEGPVRIVVAHGNITDRKRAEDALWTERNLLRTLVDSLPVAAYTKDREGRKTLVNPVDAYNLSVASAVDALGKTDFDFFPPEEAQRLLADDQAVLRDGKVVLNREEHITRRDGSTAWLLTSKVPLRDATGHIVGLVGISLDISQRRRIEEQLRKLARAVDQSPVSIVITDSHGTIEFVNPKFTQVTGYTAEEALGRNPRFLRSGETPVEMYRQLWETILAGKEWRGELHNQRKDGTLFWESASISPIRNDAGEITHFIAVKEDTSEKKSLEAKFLRAQRLESIGSLASGIAHDLNNVLAPILLCAPMLRLEGKEEDRRRLLGTIEASVQRAIDIVRQLLSFGRGGEDRQAPLQLRHLLRDMARTARETFPRSITIHEEIAGDLCLVKGNATQLFQVLLNLCVNARDAMPDGGTLTLRSENCVLDEGFARMHPDTKPGSFVRLEVADTGVGIPPEVRDRIFDAFFTTKGPEQGTGLGLTTSLGIVKNHGGLIRVTSELPRGTRFEIYLPAVPGPTDTSPSAPPLGAPAPRGHGELILVVDDEPYIRHSVERTLRQQNYDVMTAADGAAAAVLYRLNRERIAVVLTDLMMPSMDGISLCRAVKQLNPDARVIVSTGLGADPGREKTRTALDDLGVDHILMKPHTVDTLLRVLRDIIENAVPTGRKRLSDSGAATGADGETTTRPAS